MNFKAITTKVKPLKVNRSRLATTDAFCHT